MTVILRNGKTVFWKKKNECIMKIKLLSKELGFPKTKDNCEIAEFHDCFIIQNNRIKRNQQNN